jgi:CubicO group peptidase (beta-lactamase class C family)
MAAMLKTEPLSLRDGWPVASFDQAFLDVQSMSGVTQWIEKNYEYHNIHAVLIEHAGHLVYEIYLKGQDGSYGDRVFNVNSLHDLRSISKSVTSLLLGMALQGDYEKALETPVIDFFKGQDIAFGDGTEAIKLFHVLTMTAGLEWDQWTLPFEDPQNDENKLYYAKDPIEMVLSRHVTDSPGTVWKYSSGLTELLVAIIEQKTGKRFREFAAEVLFGPLGITNYEWYGSWHWQTQGRPASAWGLRMRARDLAKIGSLVLHDGVWGKRQIISSDWLRLSTQRHVDEAVRGMRGNYGYGFQWWSGHSNDIPSYKIIAGFGNGGQQLLVVPERHLVVTVFAGNYGREGQYMLAWMLNQIAAAHRKHL